MYNDPALPPNRSRPKGSNTRRRPKGENRPAAASRGRSGGRSASAGVMGVPTSLLVLGLLGAAALAYASTSSATPGPQPGPQPGPAVTPGGPNPNPRPNTGLPQGGPSPKKPRKPTTGAARPLKYAFVSSVGGEGIFDRLRADFSMIDGWGLDRICTLDNHEFAGFLTGKKWSAVGATPTRGNYVQLYMKIGNRTYNYWIAESEIQVLHSPAATAQLSTGDKTVLSEGHATDVYQFFNTRYTS